MSISRLAQPVLGRKWHQHYRTNSLAEEGLNRTGEGLNMTLLAPSVSNVRSLISTCKINPLSPGRQMYTLCITASKEKTISRRGPHSTCPKRWSHITGRPQSSQQRTFLSASLVPFPSHQINNNKMRPSACSLLLSSPGQTPPPHPHTPIPPYSKEISKI